MLKKINPFTIGLLLLLASCAKEGPTGPTGPTGPSLTGSISGHVKLYDMYGSQITSGLNKVNLYLNNSTTADTAFTTGAYSFTKYLGVAMVTGNYSITATDSGYGTTQKNNIQLVTGNLNVDIKLSAIPDSFVTGFGAYHSAGAAYDSLVISFKADSRQRNCILFASNTPLVGGQPGYYLYSKVLSISPTAPLVTYNVPKQDLTDMGMISGQPVYYAVFSYVVGDASVYEDFTTGQNVYNAVSGGIGDSTVVP